MAQNNVVALVDSFICKIFSPHTVSTYLYIICMQMWAEKQINDLFCS